MPVPLIDTHAHLEMPQFDLDREEVIRRAVESGLRHIITVGTTLGDAQKAITLAERYPLLYAAIGIHPHHTRAVDEATYSALETLFSHEKVVAVGEIGLDYYRNYSPREAQQQAFIRQIALAQKVRKPLIIHNREAFSDLITILRQEHGEEVGGVFHCFSGTPEQAHMVLDLGFYISIAGPVTYKNARSLPQVVSLLPLDRLLIETDSPYLSPHPFRGKRNEPARVRLVAERVAEIKDISLETLAEALAENVSRLFGIGDN